MAHGAEQATDSSDEAGSRGKLGNIVTDRRTIFLGGAVTGALLAVFGPKGTKWAWEHTTWGEPDEPGRGPQPNYLNLRFTPRPEFHQEHAEVFHFAGDPSAAGKPREERQHIAVIGITPEQARRQFIDTGHTPTAVYWGGDMAHIAPLGSVENLGRLVIPKEVHKPDGEQVEVLAFGATIGAGDLHLSLVGLAGLAENGTLIPGRQLESAGILTADVLADQQHQHVPVI